MTPFWQSTIRTVLKVGGGALATHGVTEGDGVSEEVIGSFLIAIGYIAGIWKSFREWRAKRAIQQMKLPLCAVMLFAILSTGCAVMKSTQVEIDADGGERTTTVKIYTFWDSKSDVAKVRASTTDKTQGLTISGLEQTSSASNAVSLFAIGIEAAARGAAKGVNPIP